MHTFSNSHTLSMLLLASLVFGVHVLFTANGCPLDPINCTIPYDDLNISAVVIIDATQYCHVDNCTVKIIKTGDELNIVYYNDLYHLDCTTTALQLLEVSDNITSYCEQDYISSLAYIAVNYVIGIIALCANVVIIIVIKQKKYLCLPLRLLLVSTVLWLACYPLLFINLLTRYTIQAPNAICITVIIMLTSFLQGANFVETEIVLTIFYTFYRCYKLYSVLSEEAAKKLFWKLIAVVFGVITIFSTSKVLIIILQEASYMTPTGYCITLPDVYVITPFTQYIGITLYSCTVVVQIIFSVCSGILLHTLSKNNNSTQADNSYRCLLKIAVILSSASLASGVVYNSAIYVFGEYSAILGTCVIICERCTILCMLLNKDSMKKFCKCGMNCT